MKASKEKIAVQLRYSAATTKTFWKEGPQNKRMYVYIRACKTSTTSRPTSWGRSVAFLMNPFVFRALWTVNGGLNTVTHRLERLRKQTQSFNVIF